jgi:hypothetical protein
MDLVFEFVQPANMNTDHSQILCKCRDRDDGYANIKKTISQLIAAIDFASFTSKT